MYTANAMFVSVLENIGQDCSSARNNMKKLCCSRQYPEASHARYFGLDITPPVWKVQFNFVLSRSPSPSLLEFSVTFLGGGMDIFWNKVFRKIHTYTYNFILKCWPQTSISWFPSGMFTNQQDKQDRYYRGTCRPIYKC